jgi:hypothetical protein
MFWCCLPLVFLSVATCSDGFKNNFETGEDCGGSLCGACTAGLGCEVPSDCLSLKCASTIDPSTGDTTKACEGGKWLFDHLVGQ